MASVIHLRQKQLYQMADCRSWNGAGIVRTLHEEHALGCSIGQQVKTVGWRQSTLSCLATNMGTS
jgi:hypothetical protein